MHRPRWGVAMLPIVLIAAASAVAFPGMAAAAAADTFSSSFETDDPQPTWSDTVDTGADGKPRTSGIDGNVVVGIPGSLRGHVTKIEVNAQPNSNENGNNLNDGDSATKWLVDTPTSGRNTRSTPLRRPSNTR